MAQSLVSRSALRTLNIENNQKNIQALKPTTNNDVKKSLFNIRTDPISKPLEFEGCKKKTAKIHVDQPAPVKTKSVVKEKVITKLPDPLPEIEEIHPCNPEDEIKPKIDEKAEGMLRLLKKWSVGCLLAWRSPDSESEDEEEDIDIRPHKFTFEEPEIEPLATEDLYDIDIDDIPEHIPSIDDIPIPFLDDSVDIEPNMGTLEVWDTSTPLNMSPYVRGSSNNREQDASLNLTEPSNLSE